MFCVTLSISNVVVKEFFSSSLLHLYTARLRSCNSIWDVDLELFTVPLSIAWSYLEVHFQEDLQMSYIFPTFPLSLSRCEIMDCRLFANWLITLDQGIAMVVSKSSLLMFSLLGTALTHAWMHQKNKTKKYQLPHRWWSGNKGLLISCKLLLLIRLVQIQL